MNQEKKGYEQLLLDYFSSQAYAYVFVGIFFVLHYAEIKWLLIVGLIFCGISTILLLAPLHDKLRDIAWKLDTWFRGGLFTASAAILIIDGMLGSLRTNTGETLFWILLSWLCILVITNAIVISKRIGGVKFFVFSLAGFGLLMIFTGHHQSIFYIIAIIGLLLSLPILDNILYEKLDAKH